VTKITDFLVLIFQLTQKKLLIRLSTKFHKSHLQSQPILNSLCMFSFHVFICGNSFPPNCVFQLLSIYFNFSFLYLRLDYWYFT